jgi:hypothetical protein
MSEMTKVAEIIKQVETQLENRKPGDPRIELSFEGLDATELLDALREGGPLARLIERMEREAPGTP